MPHGYVAIDRDAYRFSYCGFENVTKFVRDRCAFLSRPTAGKFNSDNLCPFPMEILRAVFQRVGLEIRSYNQRFYRKDVRKKDGNLETFTKCKEKSGDNLSTLPLMFLFTRKVREHPAQRDARERNVHEQRRRTSDFLSRCTPR